MRLLSGFLLSSAVFLFLHSPDQVVADGWGTITGQFVLEGEVPDLKPLIKKGETRYKDAAVCAAEAIPDESLVVDSESKGIANIFVYLVEPKKVHPDLVHSKKKEVLLKEKGCRYIPHTMIVHSDQNVRVINKDDCVHNIHLFGSHSRGGSIINNRPRGGNGFLIENLKTEKLPMEVKCDIHPWMHAYWLVVDHPYATVTDSNGKFQIKKIPTGNQKLIIWQERSGYIPITSPKTVPFARGMEVEIRDGKKMDLGKIKISFNELKMKLVPLPST